MHELLIDPIVIIIRQFIFHANNTTGAFVVCFESEHGTQNATHRHRVLGAADLPAIPASYDCVAAKEGVGRMEQRRYPLFFLLVL